VGGLALSLPFSIAADNACLAVAGLGALVAWVGDRQVRRAFRRLLRHPLAWSFLATVALSGVAALLSEDTHRAWKEWRSHWLILTFLVALFAGRSVRFRDRTMGLLAFSATLSALVGILQVAGGVRLGPLVLAPSIRAHSTLFVLTFAGIYYQVLLAELGWIFSPGAPRGRRWWVAGWIVQLVAFFLTIARGAWIALWVGAIGMTLTSSRWRRRLAAVLAVAFLAQVAIFAMPRSYHRFYFLKEPLSRTHDRSVRSRMVLWSMALEMWRDHPWLGVGLGDFTVEAEKRLRGRYTKSTGHAHNMYLQVLATQGVIGFVPFVLFWALFLRELFGRARRGDTFARGVAFAVVALLVGSLTENAIDDSEVLMTTYLLAGLALAGPGKREESPRGVERGRRGSRHSGLWNPS
jgi:O-antigen ligase